VWSPDGTRIVFASSRQGRFELYVKPASGTGSEQPLLLDGRDKVPSSWSSDGRYVLFTVDAGAPTGLDLWVLPMTGDRKPAPFLQTARDEQTAAFSPDGRWVAYQSNESGKTEVYVTSFPSPSGKWRISTNGGSRARWRRDGKEIFFLDPNRNLMAAEVNAHGLLFDVGRVTRLVVAPTYSIPTITLAGRYPYDVSSDGRFLVSVPQDQPTTAVPITVVMNWTAALNK
jgi:Tol biopolymer transport system component